MDVTGRFAELLSGPGDGVALDEACLLIAAHARGGVDVGDRLRQIDAMADGIGSFEEWRRRLFVDLGLRGDSEDYHAVDNSLLDRVIDRRRGMPITLAVLAVEVGRRAGLPVVGVGMPGHFLVRHVGRPDRFVDVFAGGDLLDEEGCRALFRQRTGPAAPFRPDYLDAAGGIEIVTRVLANLRHSYVLVGDAEGVVRAQQLVVLLPGAPASERRQLARALLAAGRVTEAADELDRLAQDDPAEAAEARRSAAELRARLN